MFGVVRSSKCPVYIYVEGSFAQELCVLGYPMACHLVSPGIAHYEHVVMRDYLGVGEESTKKRGRV